MITAAAEESVLWLTISRPNAANALDAATHDALVAELQRASADDDVAAVVLQAAGDRVFCAGADLKEFSQLASAQAALKRRELLLRTLTAMLDFPKPLLAAVQAPAIGAGAMLALACDEILMASDASLSFPEITLGLPSPMGVAMIAHRAHRQIVQGLVQLGQRLSAQDALLAGLADQVAVPAELKAYCAARAGDCAARAGHAYAVNKRWMNRELKRDLADAANAATANQHP
ncbi:enoyl-CoA hydratase/isomerase family protein [Paralcaligenes ginsengisoli]